MSLAIGQAAPAGIHGAHSRKTNFGSLVSAINGGDIDAAKKALTALTELGSKMPGPLRKGNLEAIGKALDAADLKAAKIALKDIQKSQVAGTVETATDPVSVPQGPSAGSIVNILV